MGITITLVIIGITALISWQSFTNYELKSKLIFHPHTIKRQGEWHRFLTSGFIHGDTTHLFINMFVLYQLGNYVESLFGVIFGDGMSITIFLLFYLTAVVVSSIPSYFRHMDNSSYAALGASGATSAVIAIFALTKPWSWFLFPPLPGILLIIAYLMYSSYMDKNGQDNIGHNAHLWGAIFGLVFLLIGILAFQPEMLQQILNAIASPKGPNW